jgi:hypothetical protein
MSNVIHLRARGDLNETRFQLALARRARAEVDERFVAAYTPAEFERCMLRAGLEAIRDFSRLVEIHQRIGKLSALLAQAISDYAIREMLLLAMRAELMAYEFAARVEAELCRAMEGDL